jgi:hypothetical protein
VTKALEGKAEEGRETFTVRVADLRLKRAEGGGLPTLRWELRRVDESGAAGEVVWHQQTFEPGQLEEITRNLALCGIICTMEELPSHLIKARGVEIEVEREGDRITFLRRVDDNVFTGDIERQRVAEEIPL